MNYSELIIDTSFGNLNTYEQNGNIFAQIADYQYAFDGSQNTTIYNREVSQPLGMNYYADTGILCNNKNRFIYTFVNAKPSSQQSIISSASEDISKIKDIDANIENSNFATTKCRNKQVKRTTVGINGEKKKESQYVGIEESFVTPSLQNMNAGQQFFIGSFIVLGLLLFYKAFLKK